MVNLKWWESESQLDLLRKRFDAVHMDRRGFLKLAGATAGTTAAITLLAACGDDDDADDDDVGVDPDPVDDDDEDEEPDPVDDDDEDDEDETPEPDDDDDDDEPAAPTNGLAAEQVWRSNFERDPQSHDFNKDLYCGGDSQLFAQLGKFNTDLEVDPDIAESWETDDSETWIFHIRDDTGWSNGDPVTAHDYEWSWKRQLDPETAAPYAGFLYDILNSEAFNTGEGGVTADDVGVRAIDDYTLEVVCEGPRAYMPTVVTYVAAAPAHRPSVEEHGDQWTEAGSIVTNGPWVLERWDHDVTVDSVKNENYWDTDSITLERVQRPIIGSDASQLAYENDEIDWHYRGQLGQLERVENDPVLSEEMHRYNLTGTWYLVPDPNFEPFDVLEVRLAMGHAIDRDVIVNQVLRGLATPAYTFQPPGAPGFDENTYPEFTDYDPEKAMSLLEGTPYEGGQNWPPITLTHREEGDAPRAVAEVMIQMLRENLGMEIEHEEGEPVETYERMWEHRIQLMWVRWFNDYPDPNNTLFQVWYSGFPTGHRHPWSDEEFDRLVSEARGEADEDTRWQMYWDANQIQLEQGQAIYIYNPWNYGLLKPWVTNMPTNSEGDFVPRWNIFIRDYDYWQMLER